MNMGLSKAPRRIRLGRTIECMDHVDKTLKDRVFLDISFLGIRVLATTVGGDFGRRGCGRVMCVFKVARVVVRTYLRVS
jgi:hypothetical protein